MGDILAIIGFLGFAGCVIWLIVLVIRKQQKKSCLITMLALTILFFVGVAISPSSTVQKVSVAPSSEKSQSPSSTDDSAYIQELESVQKETDLEQSSESDGRITTDAYDKVKKDMSYDEVKKIIGSDGENIFESGDKGTDEYSISYMWLGKNGGEATIGFSGKSELKVLLKSQSGLK